jgi:hypothetical protein
MRTIRLSVDRHQICNRLHHSYISLFYRLTKDDFNKAIERQHDAYVDAIGAPKVRIVAQ